MRLPLDKNNPLPLYRQIETFFRQGILAGTLAPETRLPAIRELARDLGVNRITVETAYAALETDGLVHSRMGSGTWVSSAPLATPLPSRKPGDLWPLWQRELDSENQAREDRFLLPEPRASRGLSFVDFAGGTGDPRLFPAEDFRKTLQKVMRRDGLSALEYGPESGYPPLRTVIARVLASQGLHADPEEILVTSGSQQALSLVTQLLLPPGSCVLVEKPTYAGALELFRSFDLKVVGVRCDQRGMIVDDLEPLLQQHHPRMIYSIPNFQNPTGACLSESRRRKLISLAGRYNVPVLEDDFVGDLRFEGRSLPALKALDSGGGVIYVSSFSKMLLPGLRAGFLAASGPILRHLTRGKLVHDLATSNLIQRALEAFVTVGRYEAHLRRSRRVYRQRRDTMLAAIDRHLPQNIEVHPPQGGFFIWMRLPEGRSSRKLLPVALAKGVAFTPGPRFFPEPGDGDSFLRLNFALESPEKIEKGIRRLAKTMEGR